MSQFPMNLKSISHRNGGQITTVHEVQHKTCSPKGGFSRDYWFFVADVLWADGTDSRRSEVSPIQLACDNPSTNTELAALLFAMNEHLAIHGEWFYTGRHQGWYATRSNAPLPKRRLASAEG